MKLTSYRSEPSLRKGIFKFAGRNSQGKITVRHRGGGHKQALRAIDWMRSAGKGKVVGFEYDPQRNTYLAKLFHSNEHSNNKGFYSYIVAPAGVKLFQELEIFTFSKDIVEKVSKEPSFFNFYRQGASFKLLQPGDVAPLSYFEPGDFVHNVAAFVGQGPIFARASGTFCQIRSQYQTLSSGTVASSTIPNTNNLWTKVRLPSGDQRCISMRASATAGVVAPNQRALANRIKAGRSRWLGWRPSVRGVAMNPVDHPHGGGQGKTSGGRPSVTFKSWPTKGQPTRRSKRNSRFIIFTRS